MDLNSIIKNSRAFTNIQLIGIIGSVGRGERVLGSDNLNDVDFVVVADQCDTSEKLKLEDSLNTSLNTVFSDILYLKTDTFQKIYYRKRVAQSYFDLFNDIKILFISENLSTSIDNLKIRDRTVTIDSGFSVLLTRYSAKYLDYDNPNYLYEYQRLKSISAVVDAHLIYTGRYRSGSLESKKTILGLSWLSKIDQSSISKIHSTYFYVLLKENRKIALIMIASALITIIKALRHGQIKKLRLCGNYILNQIGHTKCNR